MRNANPGLAIEFYSERHPIDPQRIFYDLDSLLDFLAQEIAKERDAISRRRR